jgi:hypothetical protein
MMDKTFGTKRHAGQTRNVGRQATGGDGTAGPLGILP